MPSRCAWRSVSASGGQRVSAGCDLSHTPARSTALLSTGRGFYPETLGGAGSVLLLGRAAGHRQCRRRLGHHRPGTPSRSSSALPGTARLRSLVRAASPRPITAWCHIALIFLDSPCAGRSDGDGCLLPFSRRAAAACACWRRAQPHATPADFPRRLPDFAGWAFPIYQVLSPPGYLCPYGR